MCVSVTVTWVRFNSIGESRMKVKLGVWVCYIEKECLIVFGALIRHRNEVRGQRGKIFCLL